MIQDVYHRNMADEIKWLKTAFSRLALDGNYTQRQLAEKLHISQPQVGRLLNIKSDFGRLELWLSVAAVFGYDLAGLLALGRSLTEGEKLPVSPEIAEYLAAARAVLEAGGQDAETLKHMLGLMQPKR